MDVVPGWATGLFPMDGASADLHFERQGAGLALGLQAISGSESVTGLLQQRGEERRGAFLAKSGVLSAGITLGADGAHVTLLASNDWLKERLAALRAPGGAAD
jgi:hypothetical protein